MKKLTAFCTFLLFILTGCSSGSDYDITMKTAPKYNGETDFPIVIEVSENGKPVEGLAITSFLEMAKMDHGTIEVKYQDKGNGLYESNVELPMAGEWIANFEAEKDGKSIEKMLNFDVQED